MLPVTIGPLAAQVAGLAPIKRNRFIQRAGRQTITAPTPGWRQLVIRLRNVYSRLRLRLLGMARSEKGPVVSTGRGTITNPAPDPPGETAGAAAPRLDPGDLAVWGGFLEVHTRLMRLLDADLVATHGMALVEYEVLFKLSTAGGQLRMTDLAQVAMLSRSGLTRIVGVLEAQRLVRRVSSCGDGRVLIATLTAAGRARLAAARETHASNVRRLFLTPLDQDQKQAIASGWQNIRIALDQHDQVQAS